MSTYWLINELRKRSDAAIDGGDPILTIDLQDRQERVYYPSSDEYRITADVVKKAKDLGATSIVYPTSWCGTTVEGMAYAKEVKINVTAAGGFFAFLKRKGVKFYE